MANTAPKPVKHLYAKPALTPQALFAKLKAQGLQIEDDETLKYISYVGHFRLEGYWFQLQDVATKRFLPDTTFAHVIWRYECDREIRAIVKAAFPRMRTAHPAARSSADQPPSLSAAKR